MFYLIEIEYVGPNQYDDRYIDAHRIEIRREPALTNMSKEVRLEGWCGTTNDFSTRAHGSFETLEAAREAVHRIFGEVRTVDNGSEPVQYDPHIVEYYLPGKFAPLGLNGSIDWTYSAIKEDVSADTTDADIEALFAEYEAAANREGLTLHYMLEQHMRRYRDRLPDSSASTD